MPASRGVQEHYALSGCWNIQTETCHILQCSCKCTDENECSYCHYNKTLSLPDLPEMTFDRNSLTLTHSSSGCRIAFNPLEALKGVDSTRDIIKVHYAAEWQAKRSSFEPIKNTPKPFDWTFTTAYEGTLTNSGTHYWSCDDTNDQPDRAKLLARDKILFHDDIMLFEDELADNGSSKLSVKCRVMPTFTLILLRFYLRVDNVMIHVQETRYYCENNWDHVLRDVTVRKASYSTLSSIPPSVIHDENFIISKLPVVKSTQNILRVLPS